MRERGGGRVWRGAVHPLPPSRTRVPFHIHLGLCPLSALSAPRSLPCCPPPLACMVTGRMRSSPANACVNSAASIAAEIAEQSARSVTTAEGLGGPSVSAVARTSACCAALTCSSARVREKAAGTKANEIRGRAQLKTRSDLLLSSMLTHILPYAQILSFPSPVLGAALRPTLALSASTPATASSIGAQGESACWASFAAAAAAAASAPLVCSPAVGALESSYQRQTLQSHPPSKYICALRLLA